ncbi:MAG: hypothetical protein NTV52_04585 [Acidobacteria bacterium]|nr:hypothetical protein [Acidobacteriota bacterium]
MQPLVGLGMRRIGFSGHTRYEAGFLPNVTFRPIPSLWGHPAGAASNPADAKFLNETIGPFVPVAGQ